MAKNVRRKRYARRVVKRSKSVAATVQRVLRAREETKFISQGITLTGIGVTTGALNTGSYCINDYMLNGGAHISAGTAVYNRVGNNVNIRGLRVKGRISVTGGNLVRLLIGKSDDPDIANMTTNNTLSAEVESTAVQIPPQNGIPQAGALNLINPSTNYKIVKDVMFQAQEPSASTTYFPIDTYFRLNLKRKYITSGAVGSGSWFLYMASDYGATATFIGTIKMEFSE